MRRASGDHVRPPQAGQASEPISKQTSQSAQRASRAGGKNKRAVEAWRRDRIARPRGKDDGPRRAPSLAGLGRARATASAELARRAPGWRSRAETSHRASDRRRHVAGQGDAVHDAAVAGVVVHGVVLSATVVPEREGARTPPEATGELWPHLMAVEGT